VQCAHFDTIPYRGYIYDRWLPTTSVREPCAVVCKSATYGYSVRMAPKAHDGTECATDSVCVDGKCLVSEMKP
jgi:hypothetical protein